MTSEELTMTYDRMKMDMDMKGMEGLTNPTKNKDIGSRIVGKSVTMKLNNKNEIVEIAGIEDLMWSDTTDMATREQMKKMFSKDQMNSLFGMMFRMYPDKPVRVGDTWESESESISQGLI